MSANYKLVKILSNKSAFIFDLDGTLVNLERLNYTAFREAISETYGIEPSFEEYFANFAGATTRAGFSRYLKKIGKQSQAVDEMIKIFREIKGDELKTNFKKAVEVKKGAVQILKEAQKYGIKTALATSTIMDFTWLILKGCGMDNFFDKVITANDVKKSKPDPEIYKLSVQALCTEPVNCIAFEDSRNGILSAKAANLDCVGIVNKGINDTFVTLADVAVNDYFEVMSALGWLSIDSKV